MEKKLQTPSQTIGPFFAYGLTPEQYSYDFNSWFNEDISDPNAPEATCTLTGQVYDGAGDLVDDAMIEIWQNDGQRQCFGRCGTGSTSDNRFAFRFNKPKSVDGAPPFLNVTIFMRGALLHLYTRIYFSDEAELNAKDEVLLSVPAKRRHTLIAQRTGPVYTIDIHMQAEQETVFFDV